MKKSFGNRAVWVLTGVAAATTRTNPRRRYWVSAAGALEVLAAALAGWPWLRVSHFVGSARQALDRGDLAAALSALQSAEHSPFNRAQVQYLLAVANRRAERLDRFERHLDRARELGWPAEDLERQEWLAVAQSGNVAAVQDRLMQAVDRGAPDEVAAEIYEAVARGHLASHRFRDAWICLDIWLQWRPDAPQARMMRAVLWEQIAVLSSATEDYRAAVQQLPKDPQAQIRLAQVLARQGELEEAETHFQAALGVAPDDPEALLGIAQCAQRRGDPAEARRCLETALALELSDRQRAQTLAELGQCLLSEGKVREAVDALARAVALDPAEGPIHYALATALARAGQAEHSRRHFDLAQQILTKNNRMVEIRRRLVESRDDADLRCEAGLIYIQLGMKKEGADWLKTALRCNPRHRKAHQMLAEYYAELGDRQSAGYHRLLAAQSPESKPGPAIRPSRP